MRSKNFKAPYLLQSEQNASAPKITNRRYEIMDVLEKIDSLRKERGWSINNLAMEAMLTQSTLNNLYVRKAEPKLSTLRAICNAFGITLAEFFSDDDSRNKQFTDESELIARVTSLNDRQKKGLLQFLRTLK